MRANITPVQEPFQLPTPEQRQAEWEKIKPVLASLMQVIREQLIKEARQREREAEGR